MVSVPQERSRSIAEMVDAALQKRRLSRSTHLYLTSAMLSIPGMSARDRGSINRLLDAIRQGNITLTD
jgi:hypothetical protein